MKHPKNYELRELERWIRQYSLDRIGQAFSPGWVLIALEQEREEGREEVIKELRAMDGDLHLDAALDKLEANKQELK